MALRGIVEQEPVREFTGDHHRLARTLMQQLMDQRSILAEMLIKNRAQGIEEYRHICGKIDGLDIAINLCQQTQDKLSA